MNRDENVEVTRKLFEDGYALLNKRVCVDLKDGTSIDGVLHRVGMTASEDDTLIEFEIFYGTNDSSTINANDIEQLMDY